MLVTLIIALALVFFVMRPLLKRVLSPEQQPLALPVSAEIGPPVMAAAGRHRARARPNGSSRRAAATTSPSLDERRSFPWRRTGRDHEDRRQLGAGQP